MKITAEAHSDRGYIHITDVIGTYSTTGSAVVMCAAVNSLKMIFNVHTIDFFE